MTAPSSLRAPEVRTYAALQLRDVDTSTTGRFMEGRAVPYGTWENVGWYLEQHEKGSLAKSIEEAANGLPLLLWHDNRTYPVGVADAWTEADDGLLGVWRMDSSDEAQRAADLAERGMLTGLSIGFVPIRSEWEYVDLAEWDPDLGPDHMDRVVRQESRLLEVSLTPTPAYAGAQVTLVRSRDQVRHEKAARAELDAWKRYRESIRRPESA